MFVYFADTDCDFTPTDAKKYGFELISMPYNIDGKSILPYVDFKEFNSKEFYDTLRKGVLPTTSALSRDNYLELFEPIFQRGDDIFYVHFSAAMTMTFDAMHDALDILKEKYPNRKFYEIDAKGITTLGYIVAREVGELKLQGKTPEEILEWGKNEVNKFAMYFFADDLKFFKHSGRVSGLTAIMGGLVGIRPIIYMDNEGKMTSIGKEIGREKAINHLVNKVVELGDDLKNHTIFVGHTDCIDIANTIVARLKEKLGDDQKIEIVIVNPTAGSHCGPNGVGIAFHAIHR